MLYLLIAMYAVIGAILGSIAVQQHRSNAARPGLTIVVWAAFWPAIFALARLLDPPFDYDAPYGLKQVASYLAAVVGLAAIAVGLSVTLSIDFARVFFTATGVGSALCAWVRPHWFWNLPKMQSFRILLGDWLARAVYFVLAAVCIWLGLFTDVQIPAH